MNTFNLTMSVYVCGIGLGSACNKYKILRTVQEDVIEHGRFVNCHDSVIYYVRHNCFMLK
jgi:hypothetical protein